MISLGYACGLRVSEVTNLCVAVLDIDELVVHIKGVKGKTHKPATFHSLRHSFATHLLENGTDMNVLPPIIQEVGFDFDWDERKVWALDIEPEEMPIKELEWHFGIPFWGIDEHSQYNLTPNDVLREPDRYPYQYERTMEADLSYPIDIMKHQGRWLLLDGLHRLVKARLLGHKTILVRKIPRSRIPDITP